MRIGVDIDGVLTNREQFQLDYGAKYCLDNDIRYEINPKEYNVDGVFGFDSAQYEEFWNKYLEFYAMYEDARPFASEAIRKLKEDGHEIVIITARWRTEREDESGEKMRDIVKGWLAESEIAYDNLIFSSEDKLDWCMSNGIDMMIEDEPKCIDSVSKGIPVICFNAKYNEKCEGENIFRCYSWYDVYNTIVEVSKV
ncbi:MAG: hypothetical protein FWC79_01770 [Oscillospiraceae bacterium]|nr:hypothetical protein [Oscillospiraceae bacterium]